MASAVAAGSVFVNSDGILNQNNQGAVIKEHRFFGVNAAHEKKFRKPYLSIPKQCLKNPAVLSVL